MYTKKRYGFFMTLNWSKKPMITGFIFSLIVYAITHLFNFVFFIPWQPISVIGIAVAFYLGFKNNSSYDRTWEARKIWGSIVNNSRTFAAAVIAFTKGEDEETLRKELMYRHIAWLTALRYQLRLSRPWEHTQNRVSGLYAPKISEAYLTALDKELSNYLSDDEIKALDHVTNTATQILKNQSVKLEELCRNGYYDDFRHMELHKLIKSFYEDQGKSERIKNFPFPRQYASTAFWLCFVFCAFVPFGMIDIFKNTNGLLFWLGPILSSIVIWVFFLMEKIGDYSENPFEGTYNDVPITSIARGIEIDIREMLDDTNIPKAMEPENGFLM